MSARGVLWTVVLLTLALGLVWATRVAVSHYVAEARDFEREPLSAVLAQPELADLPGRIDVSFRDAAGRRVAGWYVPSRNRAAVVLVHGTNTDRGLLIAEMRALAQAGFGVLAFDWPGYGLSEGQADWGASERSALTAALDWLSQQPDVDSRRIGAYGYSMGGQMLVSTAVADARVRAMALGGTPTGMVEQLNWAHREWGVFSRWPARWRLHQLWASAGERAPVDCIAQFAPRPVLLITSDADDVVPQWMVQKLYDAAQQPKSLWILHAARHGHYPESEGSEYGRRLVEFFQQALL